jgi:hypothetical protein
MKIIDSSSSQAKVTFTYNELSLMHGAYGVARLALNFREQIGYSLVGKLWSDMCDLRVGKDYEDPTEMEVVLDKDSVILLRDGFREACKLAKEFDDFQTMTGHDWSETLVLQKELDELSEKI